MVGFAAGAHHGVFHFNKVADVHIVAQLRLRTQARKRADAAIAAHAAIFQMRKRGYAAACANVGVANHAVGADFHAVAQRHIAFQHYVHINYHVLPVAEAAAQIEAGRIAQGDAGA